MLKSGFAARHPALKKLIGTVFIFWITITISFLLPRLMPGNAFTILEAEAEEMGHVLSPQLVEQLQEFYGFNKPLLQQYLDSIWGMLHGNFGISIYYKKPVLEIIGARIGWTVAIVVISTVISALIGSLLGCWSAWKQGTLLDHVLYPCITFLSEIPSFLIGFLLLYFIAGKARLLPLSGGHTPFAEYASVGEAVRDVVLHGLLPVLTLVIAGVGSYYITARQSMITVLSKDYISTARTKGMSGSRILFAHALPNAIPPIVARVFLTFSHVLGGAVLIESVFAYPGIGLLLRDAALNRDYPMLQGLYVIIAFLVIVMNAVADLIYVRIDRRLRRE